MKSIGQWEQLSGTIPGEADRSFGTVRNWWITSAGLFLAIKSFWLGWVVCESEQRKGGRGKGEGKKGQGIKRSAVSETTTKADKVRKSEKSLS